MVSTIKFEVPEPTPATAALGGVPPAPSRSLYLRYLDLTDCTRLMDAGLHIIVKNSPHLQQLFLRRCVNITGKNVTCLVFDTIKVIIRGFNIYTNELVLHML